MWRTALYARAVDTVHHADDLGVQVKGWPSNEAARRDLAGQLERIQGVH